MSKRVWATVSILSVLLLLIVLPLALRWQSDPHRIIDRAYGKVRLPKDLKLQKTSYEVFGSWKVPTETNTYTTSEGPQATCQALSEAFESAGFRVGNADCSGTDFNQMWVRSQDRSSRGKVDMWVDYFRNQDEKSANVIIRIEGP